VNSCLAMNLVVRRIGMRTDESDGMNGRRNRLVGSWIDIVVS
jgi:hypothetical protein